MRHTIVAIAILLAAALPAGAQRRPLTPLAGESPTTGIRLDAPSLVSSVDASALEASPGALGLLRGWSLFLRHAELRSGGRLGGTGDALLAAGSLPFLPSVVLGAGLQWLRPADAVGYDDSVKLSFGFGWSAVPHLSLGMTLHTFIADRDGALDGLTTLDLGLVLRPFEWAAVGFAVRDLTTPRYDSLPLQRLYDVELALRPLATRRLELGLGVKIGERRGDADPHLRVWAEPLRGLALFSHLELLRRDFYRTGEPQLDLRATVGLSFQFERMAFAVSTVLGRQMPLGPGVLAGEDARGTFQGAGISLQLNSARQPPLLQLTRHLVRIPLKGRLDERKWVELVELLHAIERRPDVVAVSLEPDGFQAGWAQTQELRAWVSRLRQRGKRSFAVLRAPSAKEYYLAAATDRILLDPAGGVQLQGLAMQGLFLRGLLDWLGVSPQYVKIAEYKSAPEQFTHRASTPPARAMREAFLSDLWHQLIQDLARDRRTTPAKLTRLIDQGPFIPPHALSSGLVDEVLDPTEVKLRLRRLTGALPVEGGALRRAPDRWPVGPAIAIVALEGDIVRGKSAHIPFIDRDLVGDETIVEALSWARGAPSIKAVVLRINSPGGSAMASDRIWREVRLTRKVKPVIVSLGDIAASGGYYAACAGDRIFAQPATTTGSIGIFTGKFDLSGLLRKLGVSTETLSRGLHARMDALDRPYTEEERRFILDRLQYYYRAFLSAVAQGRRVTAARVHAVGKGRVWTGSQAQREGLVDARGGLIDAIEEARRRVGLGTERPVRLVVLPRVKEGLLGKALRLLSRSESREAAFPLPSVAAQLLRGLPAVLLRVEANEPLTRLPFDLSY
ncbi:MAG: signal peptide peptidase SppA [Deltaproteobacteria bacterium]|nr:signal peptide peptidase SppA [Deltaproteobacteria bacterium]